MPDGSERLASRLHRGEIISLSAALAVFVIVGAIGLFVWRSNSTEIAAPAPVSTPTVVPVPLAPQPQPTADATSVASAAPAVSPDVEPITITRKRSPIRLT